MDVEKELEHGDTDQTRSDHPPLLFCSIRIHRVEHRLARVVAER